MTSYEAYVAYLAVKTHFTNGKYDYFAYNGRVAASPSSFERRSDRFRFEKLSEKSDPITFLASNVSRNPGVWIGDMLTSEESQENYDSARKFMESFSYSVQTQLESLPESRFIDNFKVREDGTVPIIRSIRTKKVSLELVSCLDSVMGFTDDWKSKDPSVITMGSIIKKYSSFTSRWTTRKKVADAIRKVFNEDGTRA